MVDNIQFDILSKVKEINEFATQLEERRTLLYDKVSECDREICDIQHAAEFFNLNAAQGYKLYKMLHDVCVRRRAYKNEIQEIDLTLGKKINKDSLADLEKRLTAINNKTYKPRILKELFES
jgi:hypothetical protein